MEDSLTDSGPCVQNIPDRFCLLIIIQIYFQQLSEIDKITQGNELKFFVNK